MPTNELDIFEVAARAEFDGVEDVVNVYQVQASNLVSGLDIDTVTDILGWLETIYSLLTVAQSIIHVYRDVRIKNVTQNRVLGTYAWPTVTAGVATLAALPPGNAGVINLSTTVPRVMLRKFYGGFTVGVLDADGSLTGATVALLNAIAILLQVTYTGLSCDLDYGYLSPKIGGFVEPVSSTVTDISGYQRRRKQGRGS